MADKTEISWADATWNPIIGCSKTSAGCANCYAERQAIRLRGMGQEQYSFVVWPKHFEGAENKKGWNGKTYFVESALTKPLHWCKPREIFVCSMSDLFHESVPFEWIDRIMDVIVKCPQHLFYFLTKRAGRQKEYVDELVSGKRIEHQLFRDRLVIPDAIKNHPNGQPPYKLPSNVHLGVTVENQDNVGRIVDLIRTPAVKRFVSFEPLLGRIDLKQLRGDEFYCPQCRKFFDTEKFWMCPNCGEPIAGEDGDGCETTCPACKETFGSDEEVPVCPNCNNCGGGRYIQPDYSSCFSGDLENAIIENIDYAFVGCESGPKARLCTLDDIRYVMQQCRDVDVKIHVKQIPLNGKCNKNFDEWPEEFRIREI